ncbi:MAG: DUF4837 family protein [Chlorobi bacterium]|nr:DUF4837 family protein [Chlorobiota bacterium]
MYRQGIIKIVGLMTLIVLMGVQWSCTSESLEKEQEAVSRALNVKVSSRGSHNEVIILGEDSLIVNRLRRHFELPFSPLGPIEPVITVYAPKDINNDLKRFRQIIILRKREDPEFMPGLSSLTDTMPYDCRIVTLRDVWSKPQWVYVVLLPDEVDDACIEHISSRLVPTIDSIEMKHLQRVVAKSHRAKEIEVLLERQLGLKTTIPINFSVARKSDSIIWLRSDEADMVHSLVFARLRSAHFPKTQQEFIVLREGVMRFIQGALPGDYVITDTILEFSQRKNLLVVRGLWRMKKQFMGGLFVSYVMKLPDNSIIYMEGFLYAPGEEKRFKIRWLEAILRNTSLANE